MAQRLLLICAALTALLGCSHRHAAETATTPDEGWTLTVINHHWLDVSIYVMTDAGRAHIGTVSATHTQSFEMPARTIRTGRTVTIEANPIGSNNTIRTEALTVQGGQRVEWTLETGLERSTVAVY
jgi:type IV pilus biogenesis protein CpaD/CtpE